MTAPNNPNERAKTAEEIVDDILTCDIMNHRNEHRDNCHCHDDLVRTIESYADSVAEERVKKEIICCWDPKSECNNALRQIATIHTKGFRAGQERMRERAASKIKAYFDIHNMNKINVIDNDALLGLSVIIRSLEVEEK